MEFEDQTITAASPMGDLHVNVSGSALKVLWGADVGPQDAEGLIAEHRDLLEQVARQKCEIGAAEGMIVTITDLDIEDGLDDETAGV